MAIKIQYNLHKNKVAPLKTRFQENNDGAGPDPKTAAYLEVREDLRTGNTSGAILGLPQEHD